MGERAAPTNPSQSMTFSVPRGARERPEDAGTLLNESRPILSVPSRSPPGARGHTRSLSSTGQARSEAEIRPNPSSLSRPLCRTRCVMEGLALGSGYPVPPVDVLFHASRRTGGSRDLRGIWRTTEPHPTHTGRGGPGPGAFPPRRVAERRGTLQTACVSSVSLNLSSTR